MQPRKESSVVMPELSSTHTATCCPLSTKVRLKLILREAGFLRSPHGAACPVFVWEVTGVMVKLCSWG